MTLNFYAFRETSFCWGRTSKFLSHAVANCNWARLFFHWSNARVYWNVPRVMGRAFSPTKKEIKPFVVLKPVSEGDFTFIFPQREQFKALLQEEMESLQWPTGHHGKGKTNSAARGLHSVAVDWGLSTKPPDLVFPFFTTRAKQISLLLSVISMRNNQKTK